MRYSPDHKQQTRERILDAAGHVFRQQGYAAAGVDTLAKEAGVTSGAFYGHFRSKQDCLAAVIEGALEANAASREGGLDGLSGPDWVAGMLQRYLSEQHWQSITGGCPIPTLISELPRQGPQARQAFARAAAGLIDRMASRLTDGDANEVDPQVRATLWAGLSMAVGGMALARAVEDPALAEEILAAGRERGAELIRQALSGGIPDER